MDEKKMIPCGFGVYVDPDSGATFEKVAGQLVEKVDEVAEAERRYVERHKKERT